ncbi:MAG: hypothetical protein LAT51_08505 [Flavobacteriaceae bacterium]|nr:hypothetical protein [Flavobacteriaceae bacterium]
MFLTLSILAILILVNLILLKFSTNEPKRPSSLTLQKSVKVVHLQSRTLNSEKEANDFSLEEERKVSNK